MSGTAVARIVVMDKFTLQSNAWIATVMAASVLAGCAESDPPQFRLNMTRVVDNQLIPAHQQAVANILSAMFGTPDDPYALPETGLDIRKLKMAAGPVWSDQRGSKHGLYRRHCAHCHGISGDGDGPTAMILDPYPRDYREGVFKFKSTYNPDRPTDEDLRTTLLNGIPATAMPSFAVLPPEEIDALVEYVKYLSMRGQMDTALVRYVVDELDYDPLTGEGEPFDPIHNEDQRADVLAIFAQDVVAGWKNAAEQVVIPQEAGLPPDDRTAEQIATSAAKGRELFYGTKANCVKCHGPTGLGDGQQDDYDIWSKSTQEFEDATASLADSINSHKQRMKELSGDESADARTELDSMNRELARRREVINGLLPPRHAIPRNLRLGTFRGGRRPLDIYRRIHQGIAGTPMPAGGPVAPGAQGTLTEEEMWQVVDYVRSLPFEPASRPQDVPVNLEAVVH